MEVEVSGLVNHVICLRDVERIHVEFMMLMLMMIN